MLNYLNAHSIKIVELGYIRMAAHISHSGCWKDGSAEKTLQNLILLILQKTWHGLPVPIPRGSQPSIAPVALDPIPSSDLGCHLHTHGAPKHTQMHRNKE